jgi:pimeloyl-ACP methyl ester carboxylesterase
VGQENEPAIGAAATKVHPVGMPIFVHDGLTLWYEESGSGPPVIFIAGTMSDHATWDIVVPQLKGLRSITPDNRDIGNSSVARRDYTVREMAGDVLALMGHLDLERASIVGHSLGGKVAQEVTLLAPARVDKLVLVCSSAQHDLQSRSLMELWISLREEIADDLVFAEVICLCAMGPEPMAKISLRDAAEMWMTRSTPQRGSSFIRNVEASLANDTLARLGEIQAPTLVVYSDCDRIFSRKHGEQLIAAIPDAQGALMEGCGHAPMADRPAEFARILQQFLMPD